MLNCLMAGRPLLCIWQAGRELREVYVKLQMGSWLCVLWTQQEVLYD